MKRILLPTLFLLASGIVPCRAETIVALTSDGRLRYFDSKTPSTFTKIVNLTGIPPGEVAVALDFRTTGQLFVVTRETTAIYLYSVDLNSGAVAGTNYGLLGSGTGVGFDFVPPLIPNGVGDAVFASDSDLFARGGPNGGNGGDIMAYDNTTSDGDPVDQHAGSNPAIVALACSNNFPEAESTVVYGIDATPNSLVTVNRDTGQLDTVGPLGVGTGTRCGFDISGRTGIAYAAFSPSAGDGTTLYKVDLGTGTATSLGTIGGQFQQAGVNVVDISVLPPNRLVNISTRARVGSGEDVMIAGFTVVDGSSRLIIRGLGPSLAAFGIASPLPNPFLTVFDANGALAANDNWKSDQQTEIAASHLAPTNDLEAAYIGNFSAGAYTAILRDANDAPGVGIVEVYKLSDQ